MICVQLGSSRFRVDVSPMPREKIRTRGAPEPITEATTVTAIVGLTLPLIKPAERDAELAAKWSRDRRAPEAVAVFTAKAMLHGKGNDVWEMLVENVP